tara:strand:- start:1339 stop:2409 length:1071 start_codon:yes stop_codon:yes gene_type:complete
MPKEIHNRQIKYSEAIREALIISMKKNKSVILLALGVDDPKGIFGTTIGLDKIFGNQRVFDMPTAENSMTGIAIGSSLGDLRPIITHQRVEFSLLSIDQIINQAAKWSYMSAGKMKVPLVIRMIIGRGWGQGPQHSQSLESLFSNIPGLKVVCPATPYDAKGMLISSIEDNNPVIFFEHRWLHNYFGKVPKNYYRVPIGKSKLIHKGNDISIVANSLMSIETLKTAKILKDFNIDADVIDLRTLRPIDINPIIKSVKKTKTLLVVDNGWMNYGISAEIISSVLENLQNNSNIKIKRIGISDNPIPSTRSLAKYCYQDVYSILKAVLNLKNVKNNKINQYKVYTASDVPDKEFTGPF